MKKYDRFRRQAQQSAEERPEQPPAAKQTYEDARSRASALERMSPYEILGVSPRASYRDVREAFGGFVHTYGEAALSDPAAGLAYQHVRAAYNVLSDYERRRRYNAVHGFPQPPLPDEEEDDRPVDVLDGVGDLAWIIPIAIVVLLFLVFLFTVFKPYWLR